MADQQLAQLLNQCQHHDVDVRVDALGKLKVEFEAEAKIEDPESVIPVLRVCLRTSNQLLSTAALFTLHSFCSNLFPRTAATSSTPAANSALPIDTNLFRNVLSAYLPAGGVFDRLGDKERSQAKARDIVIFLGSVSFLASVSAHPTSKIREKAIETPLSIFERFMKEVGLGSRAWKIREQALLSLVQIRRNHHQFPLRSYLSQLVECLEYTDAHVRDTARRSVVELFASPVASEAARADLKKEMTKRNVRKAIVDDVLSKILASSGSPGATLPNSEGADLHGGPLGHSLKSSHSTQQEMDHSEPSLNTSQNVAPSRGVLPGHSQEEADVAPVYVASQRDLEAEFLILQQPFEGKESEHNWAGREHGIKRVQGMVRGGITSRYPEGFRSLLKDFLPLSIKALNSLRTTLCISTCDLYSDLAIYLKADLDQHCEFLITHLLRLASLTKKIAAQHSQATIDIIMHHTSAQPRVLIPLLLGALKEKSPQCRTYAIEHALCYVSVHGSRSKLQLDASGASDHLERIIKIALTDSNPSVKEIGRKCFWAFQPLWPVSSEAILASLDNLARKQLEKACPDVTSWKQVAPSSPPPTKKFSITAALAASRAKARAVPQSLPMELKMESVFSQTASLNLDSLSPSPTVAIPNTNSTASETPLGDGSINNVMRHGPMTVTSLGANPPSSVSSGPSFMVDTTNCPDLSGNISQHVCDHNQHQTGTASNAWTDINTSNSALDAILDPMPELGHEEYTEQQEVNRPDLHLTRPQDVPDPILSAKSTAVLKHAAHIQDSPPRPCRSTSSVETQSYARQASHQAAQLTSWPLSLTAHVAQRGNQVTKQEEFNACMSVLESENMSSDEMLKLLVLISNDENPSDIDRSLNNATQEQSAFTQLVVGLLPLLQPKRPSQYLEYGLAVLWKIIDKEVMAIDGQEADILSVLFRVRASNAVNVLEASNLLRDTLVSQMDPVYGLTVVHSNLRSLQISSDKTLFDESSQSTLAFGLLALGKCALRLPAEIAEDELPRVKDTLMTCLDHPHSLVIREAAAAAIVAFRLVLVNESQLFRLLDGLAEDKKNLLTYLFDKHTIQGDSSSKDSSSVSDGMKRLHREMKRLDRRTSIPAAIIL